MKKIVTILFVLLAFNLLKANPLVAPLPPIISEIYFDSSGNWIIELSTSGYYDFVNLDNLRLISSSGTAQFKTGIAVNDSIICVTQDSMQSPLYFDKNGDFVNIQQYIGSWIDFDLIDPVYFGNYTNSYINQPFPGQSLIMVESTDPWGSSFIHFLAKDNTPSLGSNLYNTDSRGTFSGYIYDSLNNPIPYAKIEYFFNAYNYYNSDYYDVDLFFFYEIIADQNGFFEDTLMYGRNYEIKIYADSLNMYDTIITITIEPDSVNYYEFVLNSELLFVNVENALIKKDFSLISYPNPFNSETTISFNLPAPINFSRAIIKIFNIQGEIVRILPVNISDKNAERYSVIWDGQGNNNSLSSGNYYYTLEIDGKKVVTNKMLLMK